ncbi:MAG: hypothetical protein MI748_14025 [Opitutales bacterium]|nr:hypothetical protein [Opitutales bacterium]
MADVTLSAGIRSNLISLQGTNNLLSRTQTRLGTGKSVNTAIDNPNNFFKAASLSDRAEKLDSRLDAMGQAVSAVKSADQAITSIKAITSQLKAVAEDVKGETDSNVRRNLGDQYNDLLTQINELAKDSVYAGTNFLQGSGFDTTDSTAKGNATLTVQFNESLDQSTLQLQGFSIGQENATSALSISGGELNLTGVSIQVSDNSAGTSSGTATNIDFANTDYQTSMDAIITNVESFETQLDSAAKGLANNLSIVTTRQDFTQQQVNILQEGADKLTLADLNEEGANLLALQTSQQLGISSLSLASQSNQAVLRLVG